MKKQPCSSFVWLALCALMLVASLAGCANDPTEENPAGKIYVYEKDGFGGAFTLSIAEGGEMSYYEGALSSHIGHGNWTLEDGILTISEDNGRGSLRINRFAFDGESLAFVADGSDNFIYLKLEEGARFSPDADETYPFDTKDSE